MPYGRVWVFLDCRGRNRKYIRRELWHIIYVNVKLFVPLNYFTDLSVVLCLLFLIFQSSCWELTSIHPLLLLLASVGVLDLIWYKLRFYNTLTRKKHLNVWTVLSFFSHLLKPKEALILDSDLITKNKPDHTDNYCPENLFLSVKFPLASVCGFSALNTIYPLN